MAARRVVLEIGVIALVGAAAGLAFTQGWIGPAVDSATRNTVRPVRPDTPSVPMRDVSEDPLPDAGGDASPRPRSSLRERVSHSNGRYTVDLRGMNDPSAIVAGLQLVPAPSPPGGFTVRVSDPAAPLAVAGAHDGDVLEAINNRPTLNADQALAALAAAHSARSVAFRLRRGGGEVTVTLDVVR